MPERYKIIYGNHGNAVHLEDYFLLLKLLIESSGNIVDFDQQIQLDRNATYILIENFDPISVEVVKNLASMGNRVVIVATEFVVNGSFNNFENQQSSEHYSNRSYWDGRFGCFIEASRFASVVWLGTSDEEQVEAYEKLIHPIPVRVLPCPYFENFPRLKHYPSEEKDYDFFFSGTLTEHRKEILNLVGREKKIFFSNPHQSEFLRKNNVARSKVCLNIRQYKTWKYPSRLRYWYHLNQGCCLLVEKCESKCELDEFALSVESNIFHLEALKLVQSDYWKEVAKNMQQKYLNAIGTDALEKFVNDL